MFVVINLLFQPAVKSYLSYLPNCCFLLDNRHPIKDIFLKHGFHPLQTDLFCCLKVNVMDSVSNFEEGTSGVYFDLIYEIIIRRLSTYQDYKALQRFQI